jgi:nitroimidazol reductase NimA-like FMN-containing flavoprotein (pyridoxamine 5'-phosphate oxidase superfamily)
VIELPVPARGVLERGVFCSLAASTPLGPHATPMVFAVAGNRVWVTTSRGSVKAHAIRRDARVAGLVRAGRDAVVFSATATTHDLLDASSWRRSLSRGALVSLAAARFTRKNARFFAGYAVDAHRVPLAWMPPGRVFVELAIERGALLEGDRDPRVVWGDWGDAIGGAPSAERFRATRVGEDPLARLPADVRAALGDRGRGALALEGAEGPLVVPAEWVVSGAGLYAVAPGETIALAATGSATPRAALVIDRPSSWRARSMLGVMVRGVAEVHVTTRLTSGERSARAVASEAGLDVDVPAIVRIRPKRFVWWRGWRSGTVMAG